MGLNNSLGQFVWSAKPATSVPASAENGLTGGLVRVGHVDQRAAALTSLQVENRLKQSDVSFHCGSEW